MQLTDSTRKRFEKLPPFPPVTTRLMELLNDDDTSIKEIADLVSSDPALTIKIIQMANSPFYLARAEVRSVHDGITILGLNTVKMLTTAISLTQSLAKMRPAEHAFSWGTYWKHSYATATAAHRLCTAKLRHLRDQSFLIGMIHDIGKLIAAFSWPESWKSVTHACLYQGVPFAHAESQYLEESTEHVALSLCETWMLPEVITNGIRVLNSGSSAANAGEFGDVLVCAHRLADAAGFEFPEGTTRPVETNSLDEAAREIVDNLPKDVQHQMSILDL